MKTAIWIIAICEVIRAAQNALQLLGFKNEKQMRENAYSEFVKSLKSTDREFVERMLKEFEEDKCQNT
jgi:LPS O-antigen subunit length determinant protein (WzzB/FepE family)